MRVFLAILLVVLCFGSPSAQAETTDWMTRNEFHRFMERLKRSDKKPVKIRCKARNELGNVHIKITTAPNPKKEFWRVRISKGRVNRTPVGGLYVDVDYVYWPKPGISTKCVITRF